MGNNTANTFRTQKMNTWIITGKSDFRTPGKPFLVHNTETNQNGQSYSITFQNIKRFQKQGEIYNRRSEILSSHLVQVFGLKEQGFNVLSLANQKISIQVITQHVPWRIFLQPLNSLSLLQGLYILDGVLDGVQQLFEAFGRPFSIEPQMIGINQKGVVKIWSNQNFGKNLPQQKLQMQITSKPMINHILELVSSYVLPGELEELLKRVQKIGTLSFYKIKFTLGQYINDKRVDLTKQVGLNIIKRGYQNSINYNNRNYRKSNNNQLCRNQSEFLNIRRSPEKQGSRFTQNRYYIHSNLANKTPQNYTTNPVQINFVSQCQSNHLRNFGNNNPIQSVSHSKRFIQDLDILKFSMKSNGHSRKPSNISNFSNQNDSNLQCSANTKDDTLINRLNQFQIVKIADSLQKRHQRVQSSVQALKRVQTHPDFQISGQFCNTPKLVDQRQYKRLLKERYNQCAQKTTNTYSVYDNGSQQKIRADAPIPLKFGPIKAKVQLPKKMGHFNQNAQTTRDPNNATSLHSRRSVSKQGNSLKKICKKANDCNYFMLNKQYKTHRRFNSNYDTNKRSSSKYQSKSKPKDSKVQRPFGMKKGTLSTHQLNNKYKPNNQKKTVRSSKNGQQKETTWRPFKNKPILKNDNQKQTKREKARQFSRQLADKIKFELFKIINSESDLGQGNQYDKSFIINEDEQLNEINSKVFGYKDDAQTVKFQDIQGSQIKLNKKIENIYRQKTDTDQKIEQNKFSQSLKQKNIFKKQMRSIQNGKFIMMNEVQPSFNKQIKRKKKLSKLCQQADDEEFSLEIPQQTEINGHMIVFKSSGGSYKKDYKNQMNDETIKIR